MTVNNVEQRDPKAGNSERLEKFEKALKAINKSKKYETETGDSVVALLGDEPVKVETIPSGSLVLDSILGGGIPKGRIIEIYGQESSGKTSIALTAVANVQRQGGTALFIDLEHALDTSYAAKLGVDVANLGLAQPDHAQQALNLVIDVAQMGVADIIVVDSLAALVPQEEIEGDMEDQTIGLVARLLSKALKKLVGYANKSGTTVILINQTRDKIGGFSPFGTPSTTTGGNATKFYASQRVEVKRVEQVKDGKEVIGNKIRMTVVKNKVAAPFGREETVLTFGHGINRQAEMIEVGDRYGVVHRPNNRTYVEVATGEVIGTSKAAAIQRLEEDTEMFERMQEHLRINMEKQREGLPLTEEDLGEEVEEDDDAVESVAEDVVDEEEVVLNDEE